MKTHVSRQLAERAKLSIAGGVNSQFRSGGVHPMFYERGSGTKIVDVDGNEYIDYVLGQGPIFLGHNRSEINDAIVSVIERGILFAGQHDLEIELAEKLLKAIPGSQLVRVGSSGSEMNHAALRAARYATGRSKILKFEGHYHGWLDSVVFSIKPSESEAGESERPIAVPWTGGIAPSVSDDIVIAPFNDREAVARLLDEHDGQIAAIIMEPIMCNNGCIPAERSFLTWLREECTRRRIVLIFDEIITGFRLGLGGAQAYFNVSADIAVYGKGIAAGLPLAFMAGKEWVLKHVGSGAAIHAGTSNTNTICVAAALASLEIMEKLDYDTLYQKGRRLMDGLRSLGKERNLPILVQGPGPMFHVSFTPLAELKNYRDTWTCDERMYARFVQLMAERNVRLIGRGLWYVSPAHSEDDLETTLQAVRSALEVIKTEAGT